MTSAGGAQQEAGFGALFPLSSMAPFVLVQCPFVGISIVQTLDVLGTLKKSELYCARTVIVCLEYQPELKPPLMLGQDPQQSADWLT